MEAESALATPDLPPAEESAEASPADAVPSPAPSPTEEPSEKAPSDGDPLDRTWDRMLASTGRLDDAQPLFADAEAVPGAGVLFAIPALMASGVFSVVGKLYGGLGPAFYGLRTTFLVLLLMALWRIHRPETLKEHDPQTLGRVLGLDRAPEVKTLRGKLTRLADLHQAERLGAELARLRAQRMGRLMGFLYVDGHVRVYNGKRTIPKAHVARMRLSMPGTTDYWLNDAAGDPLFVVTAKANAGLVTMLPAILEQAKAVVGERRITVVFDRGGWSPKLFAKLVDRFDILTYRKGKTNPIQPTMFTQRKARIEGRDVAYLLNDQEISLLGGKLSLRQVTRLGEDGHQTPIITSRKDLSDIEVAWRMFERWRQENFFKYMRQEFLLDALADYQVAPDDPTRTVPNPERKAADRELVAAKAEVARLEKEYGAAAIDNPESQRPTMRGFKIAHGKIGKALRAARDLVKRLEVKRRAIPLRIPVCDRSTGAVIKLATERKHLTNIIKMLAYQAESDLLSILTPNYARADEEGRTLLHELFQAAASIKVEQSELHVTLAPLSVPHRTLAVRSMCQALNETATRFPGSNLRLRFDVGALPDPCMAFPGLGRTSHPPPNRTTRRGGSGGRGQEVRRSGVREGSPEQNGEYRPSSWAR